MKRKLSPEEEVIRQKKSRWYQHVSRARGFADAIFKVSEPKLPYRDRRTDQLMQPADSLYWKTQAYTEAVLADLVKAPPSVDPDERAERKNARRTEFYRECMARLKAAVEPYIETEVARRVREALSTYGITGPEAVEQPEPKSPVKSHRKPKGQVIDEDEEERLGEQLLDDAQTLEDRMFMLDGLTPAERIALVTKRPDWAAALAAYEAEENTPVEAPGTLLVPSLTLVTPEPKPAAAKPLKSETHACRRGAAPVKAAHEMAAKKGAEWIESADPGCPVVERFMREQETWIRGGCEGPEPVPGEACTIWTLAPVAQDRVS